MPIRISTGAVAGIAGQPVSVEVVINRGLPGFHLVGLPGAEVRESRERVLAALRHSGARVPPGRITVNLAPAGVRKSGASFDLAIALGIAAAAEGLAVEPGAAARLCALFVGELSLFGELRPVRGILPVLLDAASRGSRVAVVPDAQADEARLAPDLRIVAAANLRQVLDWCRTGVEPATLPGPPRRRRAIGPPATAAAFAALAALTGHELARKAAVVAATGRHNLLLVGPPGTGKTRLARLLADLQSPPDGRDALTITRIHSAAGMPVGAGLVDRRPFRAPHHTVTRAGLVGGGASLRPGEVTLAHGGLLFLDELAEFHPSVLDVLRQPLQDGHVTVVRGAGQRTFPARFQLVAATNPCRCGYHGSTTRSCRCQAGERARYLGRLSGPLLDRFDLFVEMASWRGAFAEAPPAPTQGGWRVAPTRADLEAARGRLEAWRAGGGPPRSAGHDAFLDRARGTLGLSLRAVHRCRDVAVTVAALDGGREVDEGHLREALEFRHGLAAAQPGSEGT